MQTFGQTGTWGGMACTDCQAHAPRTVHKVTFTTTNVPLQTPFSPVKIRPRSIYVAKINQNLGKYTHMGQKRTVLGTDRTARNPGTRSAEHKTEFSASATLHSSPSPENLYLTVMTHTLCASLRFSYFRCTP